MRPDLSEPSAPASRRAFLLRSGAVAAGATVLSAGGLLAAGPAQAGTERIANQTAGTDEGDVSSEPLVAYVSNADTGEITLMSGEREVSITDRKLARALARRVG